MTSFSLFSGATLYFLLAFSSLDTRLFTYALYCSLSRSFRRILPILASFLTFLRDFWTRFNCAITFSLALPLPSPSPFHYVMAKIVPVVQLAAHAKVALCTVVRSYNQFFRLDGLLLFRIIIGLRWSSAIIINKLVLGWWYFISKEIQPTQWK